MRTGPTHDNRRVQLLGRLGAAIGLALSSPLLAVAAIAIRLTSPGPVLFRARRIGRDGCPFVMFKLRTMRHAQPGGDAAITGAGDARVFTVGRWLRTTKVDEVPQLINIVRGQMALVGPRPEDPGIVESHYTELMRETLTVRPGLTSPGTLDYFGTEADLPRAPDEATRVYLTQLLPRKIALDLVYVRNRSWRYDAELVIRTIAAIAGVHGAFGERQLWEYAEAARLLPALTRTGPP